MKKYLVPILVLIWVIFQISLTRVYNLNPWKLGGYGMYSDYHPDEHYVWIQIGNKRAMAKEMDLFKANSYFNKMVKICRTYPSDYNLKKLHNLIQRETNYSVKIEVWRADYNSDTQQFGRKIVSKYED
ncbi:hypothetical protein ACFLR9_08055 [Bacteroidota bacterium]